MKARPRPGPAVALLTLVLPACLVLVSCGLKPRGLAGWESYRGEERPGPAAEWQAYEPRRVLPGSETSPYFWLRVRLPAAVSEDPAVYLYDIRENLEVYLEDRLLLRAGEVVAEPGEEARYRPLSAWPVVRLPAESAGKELFIRGFEPADQRSGILGAVYLGDHGSLQKRFVASDLDIMVLGFFFVLVALLAAVVGFLRKNRSMTLAFAFFALAAGSQALAFSETLFFLNPDLAQYMRGFVIAWLEGAIFLFLDRSLGRGPLYSIRVIWILLLGYAVFLALSGEVPGLWFNLAALPLVLVMIGYIAWKAGTGDLEARIIMGGMLCFVLFALNDVLLSSLILANSIYVMQWGMFLLVLSMGLTLVIRFFANEARLREYSRELEVLNRAYERFVPAEFLDQLGKESIVAVELGDQVEKTMTVLFSDIRSFTTLSERMTPAETFAFINRFLERMGPVIRRHGGFIDKYIGDAIMALFPGAPDDALRAARDMQAELERLNAEREARGDEAIRIGIGIHLGRLMLGTIGEERRMEGTVISDSVNLASRLEGLTKKSGHAVIVSEGVRAGLDRAEDFALEFLGEAAVKGKRENVRVYGLAQ